MIALFKKSFEITNISYSQSLLKQILEEDPSFPSVSSICNTLNAYSVENQAVEIEPEQLIEVPLPCFAFINIKEGAPDFVLVTDVNDATVTYFYETQQEAPLEEFQKKMADGILVLQEVDENSKEPELSSQDTPSKKSSTYATGIYILIISLLGLIVWQNFKENNFYQYLTFILPTVLGGILSVLLYQSQSREGADWLKKMCSTGKKNSCNSVLTSKYAQFLSISWMDVGLFFFSFLFLFSSIGYSAFSEKLFVLQVICIAALLYVPYSIVVQYFLVKSWCKLCLLVQLVILILGAWSLFLGNFQPVISLEITSSLLLAFIIAFFLTMGIKRFFYYENDILPYKTIYKRLLRDSTFFNFLSSQEPAITENWKDYSVGLNKPDAKHSIVMISSPYCPACVKAHKELENFKNHNEYNVFTILSLHKDAADKELLPILHVLALFKSGRTEEAEQALTLCFEDIKNAYKLLVQKFPLSNHSPKWEEEIAFLDNIDKWLENSSLSRTPLIYLNGTKLPDAYSLNDLYLLNR